MFCCFVRSDNGTSIVQTYTFDFFNYAGIHRSVMIYTTPKVHIADIITTTNIVDNRGRIFYQIITNKTDSLSDSGMFVTVQFRDREGEIVANTTSGSDLKGYIEIDNVKPWWPYLMHPEPGYLYTMEVRVTQFFFWICVEEVFFPCRYSCPRQAKRILTFIDSRLACDRCIGILENF